MEGELKKLGWKNSENVIYENQEDSEAPTLKEKSFESGKIGDTLDYVIYQLFHGRNEIFTAWTYHHLLFLIVCYLCNKWHMM